jgi:hypothetical protein
MKSINALRTAVLASVAAGALIAGVAPSASAVDPGLGGGIQKSPPANLVLPLTQEGDWYTASTAEGGSVAVPVDPDNAITLSEAPSADGTNSVASDIALPVSLPQEVNLQDASVATDGTVTYASSDGGASAQVQALSDGTTTIETKIPNAGAQHRFTYTFGDGITPMLRDDGGADLVAVGSDGMKYVVGNVAAPWAKDKNGLAVATSYEVEGSTLVQVVVPDASTVYPVTADPKFGWTAWVIPTLWFNKAETKKATNAYSAQLLCLGIGYYVPTAGVLCAANVILIQHASSYALDHGACTKVMFGPGVVSATWYKGSYCS